MRRLPAYPHIFRPLNLESRADGMERLEPSTPSARGGAALIVTGAFRPMSRADGQMRKMGSVPIFSTSAGRAS